jgi:hypothetical protein
MARSTKIESVPRVGTGMPAIGEMNRGFVLSNGRLFSIEARDETLDQHIHDSAWVGGVEPGAGTNGLHAERSFHRLQQRPDRHPRRQRDNLE